MLVKYGSDSDRSVNRKQPGAPNSAYGPSKAAAHWFTRRIDAEEEKLTAFVVHPGYVDLVFWAFVYFELTMFLPVGFRQIWETWVLDFWGWSKLRTVSASLVITW